MPVKERPLVPEEGGTKLGVSVPLTIVFCAIVSVPIVFQPFYEIAIKQPFQELDVFKKAPTAENLQRYQQELADSGYFVKLARPYTQWAMLSLMGQGNEKVVIGRGGWLFHRPDLRYPLFPSFRYYIKEARVKEKDPFPAVVDFYEQLKARNIDLVIVPIPVKPMIYPEKLTRLYDVSLGPPANEYTKEFFDRLQKAGMTVIDLTQVLWDAKQKGEVYMPLDTHWTPFGMKIFTDALSAEVIKRHPWLNEGRQEFRTETIEITNWGDTFDMLLLPGWSSKYPKHTISLEQVLDTAGEIPIEPDPDSPVVLLGDSFANVFSVGAMKWGDHAGLGEHLALRLGRRLDVIAVNGGAPTGTRRNLARRGNLGGKRLVIWEFITRDLSDPKTVWEVVKLPEAAMKAAGGPIEVTAEVIAVSKPPRPGEDPYAHCITYTKYKVVSVEKGEYEDAEILAVRWVMRDFKLLPSADIKKGEVHRMSLTPYREDIHPDLKQSKETDDTGDLVHQPYWVVETKQ